MVENSDVNWMKCIHNGKKWFLDDISNTNWNLLVKFHSKNIYSKRMTSIMIEIVSLFIIPLHWTRREYSNVMQHRKMRCRLLQHFYAVVDWFDVEFSLLGSALKNRSDVFSEAYTSYMLYREDYITTLSRSVEVSVLIC